MKWFDSRIEARPMSNPTPPTEPSPKIHGLFSHKLEREARNRAWSAVWSERKGMIVAFYAVDIGAALVRAIGHVALWVPAILLWPLLLSSNGIVKADVLGWLSSVSGAGWNGALWKLIGAVFVASMCSQLMAGVVGARLRLHLDRIMERSLLWNLIETQLPGGQAGNAAKRAALKPDLEEPIDEAPSALARPSTSGDTLDTKDIRHPRP